MKKLFLMLTACCMIFAACNNQKTEEVTTQENDKEKTEQTCEKEGKSCCKEMAEKWANFDNLTAEEQASLIEKKGECITKILEKVNLDEIACPNAKKGVTEFKTKWEGFASADQKTKKELIDEFENAHWKHAVVPADCCKKDSKCESSCDNKCGKDCKTECCKDNCEGKDCKHNCK